jgi:hypothetical protein
MEPKDFSTINLTQKEIKDIQQFCKLNKIEDIPTFLHTCAWKGYEVEKFGILGKTGGIQEKRVEIEVIREKRVEIPVEVIKEVVKVEYVEVPVEVIKEVTVDKIVEVIKEVPVDKVVIQEVIKEVPVEKVVTKIEYISDKTSENELLLKLQQLENEKQEFSTKLQECNSELVIFSTKTQKNENIFQDRIKELESREPERIEIIKEVVVEKTTTDNSKQKALEETIQKIRTELQLKNKEINDLKNTITEIQVSNGRQGIFLDGSNLNRTINNRK